MTNRIERISKELMHQVSRIIHDEAKDPRIGFITVTKVEVSADLRHARIFFTALGNQQQKKYAEEGLKNAAGFIRKELGAGMRMRYVPALEFKPDKAQEAQERVSELLKRVERERGGREDLRDNKEE